jgi:hypothetical protein
VALGERVADHAEVEHLRVEAALAQQLLQRGRPGLAGAHAHAEGHRLADGGDAQRRVRLARHRRPAHAVVVDHVAVDLGAGLRLPQPAAVEAVQALRGVELVIAARVPHDHRLRAPRRDVERDNDQLEDGRREHRREDAPRELDAETWAGAPAGLLCHGNHTLHAERRRGRQAPECGPARRLFALRELHPPALLHVRGLLFEVARIAVGLDRAEAVEAPGAGLTLRRTGSSRWSPARRGCRSSTASGRRGSA